MIRLLIALLFFCVTVKAQSPKVSLPELGWALVHPIAALKVKSITKKCNGFTTTASLKFQLDSFSNGGKADAYRHAFFMAAYSQKIKVRKLRKLGKAHEKSNYRQFLNSKAEDGEVADSLSCIMDLTNNELGFIIGSANKKISLAELSQLTITKIKKGQAVIIKRDLSGQYLTCEGKRIEMSFYKGKWFVPKCLVPSAAEK